MPRVSQRTSSIALIIILIMGIGFDTQLGGASVSRWLDPLAIVAMIALLVWEYASARKAGRRFIPPRPRQLILPALFVAAGAIVGFTVPNMLWGIGLIIIGGFIYTTSMAGNVEQAPAASAPTTGT